MDLGLDSLDSGNVFSGGSLRLRSFTRDNSGLRSRSVPDEPNLSMLSRLSNLLTFWNTERPGQPTPHGLQLLDETTLSRSQFLKREFETGRLCARYTLSDFKDGSDLKLSRATSSSIFVRSPTSDLLAAAVVDGSSRRKRFRKKKVSVRVASRCLPIISSAIGRRPDRSSNGTCRSAASFLGVPLSIFLGDLISPAARSVSSPFLSFRGPFFPVTIFLPSFPTTRCIVSGLLVGIVLTIVRGLSRDARFRLLASPFTSEQDEDTERKDSSLMTNFAGGLAMILALPAICALAPVEDGFDWLDVLLVAAPRCSAVPRNGWWCPAATIREDLSVGRFDLPVEEQTLLAIVADEGTLALARASPRFCGAFLATSTGEDNSAGDLLSLLHDCSCSRFVRRGLSLLEEASVLVAI